MLVDTHHLCLQRSCEATKEGHHADLWENTVGYTALRIIGKDILVFFSTFWNIGEVLVRPECEFPTGSHWLGKLHYHIVTVLHINIHHLDGNLEVFRNCVSVVILAFNQFSTCKIIILKSLALRNLDETLFKRIIFIHILRNNIYRIVVSNNNGSIFVFPCSCVCYYDIIMFICIHFPCFCIKSHGTLVGSSVNLITCHNHHNSLTFNIGSFSPIHIAILLHGCNECSRCEVARFYISTEWKLAIECATDDNIITSKAHLHLVRLSNLIMFLSIEHLGCQCTTYSSKYKTVFIHTFAITCKSKVLATSRSGDGQVAKTKEAYIRCAIVNHKIEGFWIVLSF